MRGSGKKLTIRRFWGRSLDLFLAGDLLATVFLPLWISIAADGITGADAGQMLSTCLLLFLLTLALRLAVLGLGLLLDRRVLGVLDAHALVWGEGENTRRIALNSIRAFGYCTHPFARLFRLPPTGLRLVLDRDVPEHEESGDEVLYLPHAPLWLALSLSFRCPNARRRPNCGFWLTLGVTVCVLIGLSIWLGVGV